jgi:putative ABC transport system permease protein
MLKNYIKIAIPAIIYIGNQWLSEFAYRVGLSWQIFALPVLFILFIILVIVAVQIYRSSVMNPVASLRSE